jgi:hypothetical protein
MLGCDESLFVVSDATPRQGEIHLLRCDEPLSWDLSFSGAAGMVTLPCP